MDIGSRRRKQSGLLLMTLAAFSLASFAGADTPVPQRTLIYAALGTNAGPTPNPGRSQPAGVVRYGDTVLLVDAGDGVAEQLAKAGISLDRVQGIAISHLHFDHIGGLFGLLALRRQNQFVKPLTIYGPPGIKATVRGVMDAMAPGTLLLHHLQGSAAVPGSEINVVEMEDKATAKLGPLTLTARENSHFVELPADTNGRHPVSLAYRIDAPHGSITYTGDTGPSANVEALCRGTDMLVSEIMDPVTMMARVRRARPDMTDKMLIAAEDHFRKEHLSPDEVGLLADRCGARSVVLVHSSLLDDEISTAHTSIARHFKGRIDFAADLDSFSASSR